MSIYMNQFKQSNLPGITMNVNPDTIEAKVYASESEGLVPGDVIKFVAAEAGDVPVITKISTGELGDGVVLFNARQASFSAGDICEIGLPGTIVTMVAGTAFNRGDVYYNASTGYVSGTSGLRNGKSLDIASAAGDIVRVLVAPLAA